MYTPYGHLTYCSNIHAGENWNEHFANLKEHIPLVKEKVCPDQPFGIGLRLSNYASLELRKEENLKAFQQWLQEQECYVFTMNGFPYGGFHHTIVKDRVHSPDWTTAERVQYTIRLAQILAALLPEGVEGGISTSPLSYRFWHTNHNLPEVHEKSAWHVLQVVEQLIQIKKTTGAFIHLDIEPEPDGLLGDSQEFLEWYTQYLLPIGIPFLQERLHCTEEDAATTIKSYVQLCYDICHMAICYEDHFSVIQQLQSLGIKTGKLQISAALKAGMAPDFEERKPVIEAFQNFNEPTYLHQVVAKQANGELKRFADMPDALAEANNPSFIEWRAHFHVPLFIPYYGILQSTQQDIGHVLRIHQHQPFTSHLEIETYTWEVLPPDLRLPMNESIVRELQWVINLLALEKRNKAADQAYHA